MRCLGVVLCFGLLIANGCSDDDVGRSNEGGAAGSGYGGKPSGGRASSGGASNRAGSGGNEIGPGGTTNSGGAPTLEAGNAGAAGTAGVIGGGTGASPQGGASTNGGAEHPGNGGAANGGAWHSGSFGGRPPSLCGGPAPTSPGGAGGAGGAGNEDGCFDAVANSDRTIQGDAGAETLRGVSFLIGNLNISGKVTNLAPLHCLRTVFGSLRIDGTELTDLRGLDQLSVVREFTIGRNDQLTSLAGLERLSLVEGQLSIGQTALANLCPLQRLTEVGALKIVSTHLHDLRGLEGIRQLGSLDVGGNEELESLEGLDGLVRAFGSTTDPLATPGLPWPNKSILLRGNPRLQSLSGLSNLSEAFAIGIYENASLANIEALAGASGVRALTVHSNASLSNCDAKDVARRMNGGAGIEVWDIAGNAPCPPTM